MDKTKTYDALLFRQRPDSPLQVAFAAPSDEIDSWARVPTKKTGNVRNFQRAQLPQHIKEVERFFGNKANASPTAVVVGFDPIRAQGRVRAMIGGKEAKEAEVPPGAPLTGKIEISWADDSDPATDAELVSALTRDRKLLKQYVYAELKDIVGPASQKFDIIVQSFVELIRSGKDPEAEESDPDPSEQDTDAVDLTPDIEVPEEIRSHLAGLSPSEQQVVAGRLHFVALSDPELLKGQTHDYLLTLYRAVADELKPAILIDGQHRVMGTKKIGSIPFLVTALPSAAWPELAFQFIVTNRTSKRVPESLLISIVGNSLSKQQRSEIEERLREANIRVGLIEAVMQVHENELSPFHSLLSFGLKNEEGFLDAAAMRGKVIQMWYERLPPVSDLFEHLCEGKRRSERTDYWKSEELWFTMFVAFWSAVKKRYEGSAVFSTELLDKSKKTPASKLMTATVLKVFQETVLIQLLKYLKNKENKEGVQLSQSLKNERQFDKLVTNTLTKLTPDFFEGWTITGFDGSKGAREDLSEAINLVIEDDKTVAQLKTGKNPHRLFKSTKPVK